MLSTHGQVIAAAASSAPSFDVRAAEQFKQAKTRFETQTNAEAAWQFGRACFDGAEASNDRTRRAELAETGIAACREGVLRNPASAPAHYYLGMNLGELADTRRNLSGLRLVKEMEREFLAARDLDEHFDFAGADRNLGLLYMQAPVFMSIGSRTKARQYLRRAVEVAPEYPENRLNLIEACLKWNETKDARRELKALEENWSQARSKFSSPTWAGSWSQWDKRFIAAKRKLDLPSKQLESPHEE
jgi:tetratricopeptide (TPR) repeat protein